ncbi:hypothetical protein D9M68_575100 [compost metagenome]
MSPAPSLSIDDLRQRLHTQRRAIAHLLEAGPYSDDSYPRSMTMRFLTQRPALAAFVLAEIAARLLGARYFKSLSLALAVAKLLHGVVLAPKQPTPASEAQRLTTVHPAPKVSKT